MALFGLFGKKSDASPLKKHAERVANKRAQAIDRWESIQALAKVGDREAVESLLPRFTFYVDPSITDQEEKDAAFDAVVACGELAIEPVVSFLGKVDSIAWPLKMLSRIASDEAVVGYLLDQLAPMDTVYERDPQKKIDLIAALEERQDSRIVAGLKRFLGDANETVRFSAAGAILAQEQAAEALQELAACVCTEESVRVRNRILDGLSGAGLLVPEEQRADFAAKLTPGFAMESNGAVAKR